MNFKNLFFGAILAVELIGFLVIPSVALAEFNLFGFSKEENPQTFSEFQAKNILTQFSKKIFNYWNIVKSNAYSDPREATTLSFLRQAINYDVWNYIFQDLPIETSIKVGKALGEIIQVMNSDNSMKLAMEKIEKGSVKISVDYIKKELFKREVKTAFGATKVKYDTGKEKVDTNFQYIMAYIPIDDTKGNLVTRIYSPYELSPPQTSTSYGLAMGVVNDLKSEEKIPPFVVEFKGVITNKNFSWYYQWESEPEIKVYFPNNVPDFGFKSIPWYDKYIINPIKRSVNGMIDSITGLFSVGNIIEYINLEESNTPNEDAKKEAEEMINGINNYEKKEEIKKEPEIKNIETVINEKLIEQPKEQEQPQKKEEIIEESMPQCSLNNYNPKRNAVLINEIAWMGSLNSSNDEWIELKNISSSEINLKNWSLYDKDKQISVLIEKDLSIPPQGFVLLERTDDNSVPFVKADQIYAGTISNSDESLYLFNQNCELEDFVEASPSWPAGNSKQRLTMERGKDLTWHEYNGSGYMNIFGTPKQENSIGEAANVEVKEEKTNSNTINNTISNTGGGGGISISYCSQSNLNEPLLSPVIINEIAWMGTEVSSSDEWIELKNISQEEINMNGWQLLDKDNQIKIIFDSSDIIPANDFYLLERTDDTSVPNVGGNKIYSGALSDANESLRLFNQNCQLIDQSIADSAWLGGDSDLKKTMERDSQGWHTYSSSNYDGISGLWGTPKKENSQKMEESNVEEEEQEEQNNNEEELITPQALLITEISLGKEDSNEYVEIFNQTESEINLCSDENNCYYLSYFASTFNDEGVANHSWDDPSYNWQFPENLMITPNSYILIDIYGNSGGDFKVGEYSSQKLSNSSGSLSLFSNNPIYDGEEEKNKEEKIAYAQSLKVDAVAWRDSDKEPEVREGGAFFISQEKTLGRKYYSGKYVDSNNNINDIEGQEPSIKINPTYPPGSVNDLSVAQGNEKNSVILSWTSPLDPDTSKEDLDYEIYYSLNKEIDSNNLLPISDYVETRIIKEEGKASVLIQDLYYDSTYYFTIKAKDKELNYSEISNIVNTSILKAEHIKPFYYFDFGLRNKSFLPGPTNENTIETVLFMKSKDSSNNNNEFSLPIIDQNENIYISGKIDGIRGVSVFNKQGEKKWEYACFASEKMFLSSNGTLYLFCDQKLTALSPSGKLKWQEYLGECYREEMVFDSNEKIYIFKNSGNAILNVIEDKGDSAQVNSYEFEKHYESLSNIVPDKNGNVYFFGEDKLFKFNGMAKMGERVIENKYEEEYQGEKDKIGRVNNLELTITSNGIIIFNFRDGKYDSSNKSYSILYAINKDNINGDFLWSKEGTTHLLSGSSGEDLFTQSLASGDYGWYHLYLHCFDVLTGEEKWNKHWASNGSSVYSGSFIVSDNRNNVYFNQGAEIKGYNSKEISDDNPVNDIIFSVGGIGYFSSTPVSIGNGSMYYISQEGLKKVIFNP